MKKKSFLCIAFSLLIAVSSSIAFAFSSNYSFSAKSESNHYRLVLNSQKNKLHQHEGNDGYDGSKQLRTELGNTIGFQYHGIKGLSTTWHVLGADGYFYNTNPINGIESITFTFKTDNADFDILYSYGLEFDHSQSFVSSKTESVTFDFDDFSPNYIKVLNKSGQNFNISSIEITFSCSSLYNVVYVTSNDDSLGYVSGGGGFIVGHNVTITATCYSCGFFTGWYEGDNLISTEESYTFAMPDHDVYYVAVFAELTYSVLVNYDSRYGNVIGAGNYKPGCSVTITAVPNEHCSFIGWYWSGTQILVDTSLEITFTMTSFDREYDARFIPNHFLFLYSENESRGIVEGPSEVGEGQEVTISAIPLEGYQFDYWYDEDLNVVSRSVNYKFTMPSNDVTLYASFTLLTQIATITNKDALSAQWVTDVSRDLQIYIENTTAEEAVLDGNLIVSSSNPDVVEVSSSMLTITAHEFGEATIAVKYKGANSDSIHLKVDSARIVTAIDTSRTDYKLRWFVNNKALYAAGTKGQVDKNAPYYLDPSSFDESCDLSIKEEGTGDYKYSITFANGNIIAGKRDASHTNIGFTYEEGYEKLLFKFNDDCTFSCKLALNDVETEYWLAGYQGTNEKRLALQQHSNYISNNAFARLVDVGDPTPASAVILDKNELTLKKGEVSKLEARIEPYCLDLPIWESNNESVVRVSDGTITAYGEGDAIVSASYGGKSASCVIHVQGTIDYGTADEPLNTEQAHILLDEYFADGTVTPFYVYVKGIVRSIDYNSYVIKLSNPTNTNGDYFTINGYVLDDGVTVNVGDEIVVRGYARIYFNQNIYGQNRYELFSDLSGYPLVLSSSPIVLTSIEIDPGVIVVNINNGSQEVMLGVRADPIGAKLETISWSINENDKNVTINQNGRVTIPDDVVAFNADPVEFTVTARHEGIADATAKIIVKNVEEAEMKMTISADDLDMTSGYAPGAVCTYTKGGLTVVFSGVWKGTNNNQAQARVGRYSTVTFSGKIIKKIEFVCANGYDSSQYGAGSGFANGCSSGAISADVVLGNYQTSYWNGNTDNLVLTADGHQVRIYSIVITYSDE